MINPVRTDANALLAELELAGAKVVNPKKINCPFHDDTHPSSGIYLGEDGVWRFKCQACGAGGDIFDIRAKASNRAVAEVLKEAHPAARPQPTPKVYESIEAITATLTLQYPPFSYTNPKTRQIELVVIRYLNGDGKKAFMQCSPISGGWIMKAPPRPLPLYNRTRILKVDKIVVVEGETCVHALADIGIIATTSPGGAGKAAYADWTPMAGKDAYLWPDNDPVGVKHMREAAGILEKLNPPARCLWIDPASLNLPPKGDVVDYLAELADLTAKEKTELVQSAIDFAHSVGASAEVSETLEAIIQGRQSIIKWPWPTLGKISRATYPGTITVLCGGPGASKSFMLLEVMMHWHKYEHKCALYELEENRRYHLRRVLAQLAANANIADDEWVKYHPDETRNLHDQYAAELDSFGRIISASPDSQLTLDEIAKWIETQANSGIEIIAIDPITAAVPTGQPWIADSEFLMRVKPVIQNTGARLLLITHPKKGHGKLTGLDELAGGASYQRLAQTVLWLELHYPPLERRIIGFDGIRESVIFNRTIHVCKARNGIGTGTKIACQFDVKTLKMRELGIVEEKQPKEH